MPGSPSALPPATAPPRNPGRDGEVWQNHERGATISAATRLRMADPRVREKIRAGMMNAAGVRAEAAHLRAAWAAARPTVRRDFLEWVLSDRNAAT
jgi:hypothetical protein